MAEYKVLSLNDVGNYSISSYSETISGAKTFKDMRVNNIPEDKNMPYFLGIEAFTNGGTVKYVALANTKVGYATTAGSAPAADVYSWAKASSKPSYSWSEITGKPTIPSITISESEPTNSNGNNNDLWITFE